MQLNQGFQTFAPQPVQQIVPEQAPFSEFACYQFGQLVYTPPDAFGPLPGITHEEFSSFNVDQQREFLRFLTNVGDYQQRWLPRYHKEMDEYLKKDTAYTMNEEEGALMQAYYRKEEVKAYYKALEEEWEAYQRELRGEPPKEEKVQQTQAVEQPAQTQTSQQQPPADQPPTGEVKKERKKLSLASKGFVAPKKPTIPVLPTPPSFINKAEFYNLYDYFIFYYNPTTEFTKFPTEEDKKKQEEQKKKKVEQQAMEAKMKEAKEEKLRQLQVKKEVNRFAGMKEEKVNVEDLQIDTTVFIEPDESRRPLNLVFIGHVDAGKSTLCGRILVDSGEISQEDIRKFEQEAKENNRESWWLAYCMDINEEERAKGKTVECGKAQFQTQNRRFTLFDAPGHKNYIPNMIMGACQADLAGLIISAKTGEFESGFQKGGQTQEHAFLAKSLGVDHLIVIITKMDTVDWDQKRFEEIQELIQKFIQDHCQFKSIHLIPIDALVGDNCSKPVDPARAPWYKGPYLMQLINDIDITAPNPEGPIRIPILDKLKDQGLHIFGKVESGTIVDGLNVAILPRRIPFQIVGIYNSKDQRMKYAKAGENVKIKVKGIEEEDIQRGAMVCNLESNPCPITVEFQVKIHILELPEHKRILSQGYTCVLHLHCLVEEVEVSAVEAVYDAENKKMVKQAFLKSNQDGILKLIVKNPICIEKAETLQTLGRFALRDEGRSIAFGEVTKIKPFQKKEVQGLPQ